MLTQTIEVGVDFGEPGLITLGLVSFPNSGRTLNSPHGTLQGATDRARMCASQLRLDTVSRSSGYGRPAAISIERNGSSHASGPVDDLSDPVDYLSGSATASA